VLEADSHAKVQMRRKVRGLRKIEQAMLKQPNSEESTSLTQDDPEAHSAGAVVLAYCAAVRGILNDDQGGPLHPPGLRMAEALQEVRESVQRNLDVQKGGFAEKQLGRLAGCIDRGLEHVQAEQEPIREYVKDVEKVAATLETGGESCADRREKYEALIDQFQSTQDPIRQHMAAVMISFLAGLFVGEGTFEEIRDNLDLERWFRLPKSHERRIHGHRHAGIRIVLEGPTLVHALDAHVAHPAPFTAEDLLPYRTAQEPPSQEQALNRRKIMRKARSKKSRPKLLADLEQRYQEVA